MASVENVVMSPPVGLANPQVRKHWSYIIVVLVFAGSVVAFMDDGGLGNIDALLGQYGVTRVRLTTSALTRAVGSVGFGSADSDSYNEDEWGPATVFELLNEDDVSGEIRKVSRLPRTVNTPYNHFVTDMSQQYFLYSPSGGWSNQRMCLLSAIGVCRDYNLTLLVPPAARHSNFEMGYLNQTVETTIPMDQVLDIEYMKRAFGINIVPLNGTLQEFWEKTLGGTTKSNSLVTYPKWVGKMMLASAKTVMHVRDQIKRAKTPIIFAKGRWYSRKYYPTWYNAHTRYSPYFQELSLKVMKALGNDFDSFHVRLGDYEERALKRNADCGGLVSTALQSGMSVDRPVYLATDGEVRDEMGNLKPFFKPMGTFKRIVSQVDLAEIPDVAEALVDFKRRLPTTKIYMDTFGMVEQMIAARGRTFIGTSVSTFSRTISHIRHYLVTTVPDMITPSKRVPWNIGSSYLAGWSGRLASRGRSQDLTKPYEDLEFGPKAPNTDPDRYIAVRKHGGKRKGGKNGDGDA